MLWILLVAPTDKPLLWPIPLDVLWKIIFSSIRDIIFRNEMYTILMCYNRYISQLPAESRGRRSWVRRLVRIWAWAFWSCRACQFPWCTGGWWFLFAIILSSCCNSFTWRRTISSITPSRCTCLGTLLDKKKKHYN